MVTFEKIKLHKMLFWHNQHIDSLLLYNQNLILQEYANSHKNSTKEAIASKTKLQYKKTLGGRGGLEC